MATTLPIPYVHLTTYFAKGIDQGGPYYRVEYYIGDYANADLFVNALLGKATLIGGIGGTTNRVSPHQHPLSPNLWCQSAEISEGLGTPFLNAAGFPAYTGGAIIRAEYRAPVFDFVALPQQSFDQDAAAVPTVWATQELDFGTEVFTVENGAYTFQTGPNIGKPCGVPAKIEIPVTTMILTYERLPYLAMTAVRTLRGRINNARFLGADVGLVRFVGAHTTRQFNTDGTVCQKTQFVFIERDADYPWNNLPSRNGLGAWHPVADGSGNRLYRAADLRPLAVL